MNSGVPGADTDKQILQISVFHTLLSIAYWTYLH
jgi:hypothetical protein